ncbi:MAG: signal peptide peptidase SppA [Bacteroidales bacterium]|nr:signal peptide peptidase SppA [Bacteroidales bacterium]
MKDFVKMVLAVLCGLFIVWILGFIFLVGMAGSAALSGGSKPVLPREGVLDINYDEFVLAEQTQELSFSGPAVFMGGAQIPTVGLWDAVQSIKAAAADPSVKYILLRGDAVIGGISDLEEFRAALVDFRKSGKAVVAYTENPGNGTYYLNTAADRIFMCETHGGMSQLIGLSGRMVFLKDLLDKFGVHYQLIRHGKFKSAGEMFIKNAPSEENLLQHKEMIQSIWKTCSGVMAESRGIEEAAFNDLIDNLKLNFPEDFLLSGLVDSLVNHEKLVDKLCTLAMVESKDDLHLIPFADYVAAKAPSATGGKTNVAVIFADGDIVDGDELQNMAGDRFVRVIDEVRRDKSVKAVVLRVNSPGGSVMASAKIKDALDLLKAEKPLVASYGNYAASGGYWISNGCEKIYSDATCLTGSIGVFSLIPEFSKTVKDVAHVNVVTVGSNKHSDMFSLVRPFDGEETAYLQAYVEDIYTQFVNMVAEGRDMTPEAVDEIAQGRVWTGAEALGIGLVDEIGTLGDAVAYAASLAGLVSESDYQVAAFPRPLTAMEQIMEMMGKSKRDKSILAGTPFAAIGRTLEIVARDAEQPARVFAAMPYSIEIR